MNYTCKQCEKWQNKQKELLENFNNIFDVHSELEAFEKDCIKTCPYLQEIVDTSSN